MGGACAIWETYFTPWRTIRAILRPQMGCAAMYLATCSSDLISGCQLRRGRIDIQGCYLTGGVSIIRPGP
jgi:hypothetical protein